MVREIGKFGRLPVEPENYSRALSVGKYLTGTVPVHPASADYLSRINNWKVLGNDVAGDCVAVTWANERYLATTVLTDSPVYPDQEKVWEVYETQSPRFDPSGDSNGPGSRYDRGMVIQNLLERLNKNAGPDGVKVSAFAKVDVDNLDEVKAALAIFGSLWVGIVVTDANEREFANEQPWDYDRASRPLGGHSVIVGGYDSDNVGGDERFITWAEETSFTDAFWANQVEEAWVVIWPEHLGSNAFMEGMKVAELASDYEALTGRSFPSHPKPQPTPNPVPEVDSVDQELAAQMRTWLEEKGL